ncbi:unnamed protein product [Dracunculus medinensis]|uniref:Uncharacterized protein n=1 Tax=Dracunculus medinensis TaxID=318479 RepID=A0A0N4U989_DRAME|nr:unnamed protein product [Dracunculus medinensis]
MDFKVKKRKIGKTLSLQGKSERAHHITKSESMKSLSSNYGHNVINSKQQMITLENVEISIRNIAADEFKRMKNISYTKRKPFKLSEQSEKKACGFISKNILECSNTEFLTRNKIKYANDDQQLIYKKLEKSYKIVNESNEHVDLCTAHEGCNTRDLIYYPSAIANGKHWKNEKKFVKSKLFFIYLLQTLIGLFLNLKEPLFQFAEFCKKHSTRTRILMALFIVYFIILYLDLIVALLEMFLQFIWPFTHIFFQILRRLMLSSAAAIRSFDHLLNAAYCDIAEIWCQNFKMMCENRCSFLFITLEQLLKL